MYDYKSSSKYGKYYMGKMHSLKIVGFLNNYFPLLPEIISGKYEGYHFDKRGMSKEQCMIRLESYLYCFKKGAKYEVRDIDDCLAIMQQAYRGQNLMYGFVNT